MTRTIDSFVAIAFLLKYGLLARKNGNMYEVFRDATDKLRFLGNELLMGLAHSTGAPEGTTIPCTPQ